MGVVTRTLQNNNGRINHNNRVIYVSENKGLYEWRKSEIIQSQH